MIIFVSPLPHEKAAWHAAARRMFAAIRADLDAEALMAFENCQAALNPETTAKAVDVRHTCGKPTS